MRRLLIALGAMAGTVVASLVAGVVLLLQRLTRRAPPPEPPEGIRSRPGRLLLVTVPASTLVGLVFFITIGLPWLLERQHFPMTPGQPIYFDHEIHTQVAGLECEACHITASIGQSAGVPDVQQCMFCHVVVGSDAAREYGAEIERLQIFWQTEEPIDWRRIHRIPDHTRFPHDAHVQAGVPCATCHGDVGEMGQVRQVRSLKMTDCVNCHQETSTPVECGVCHY